MIVKLSINPSWFLFKARQMNTDIFLKHIFVGNIIEYSFVVSYTISTNLGGKQSIETGFLYIAQGGLELICLSLPSAEATDMN
jgi:hypothetical protein